MKLPSYLVALFLAFMAVVAAPPTSVRAEEATFDVFYTSLADEGDWYNTPDYGYVWQPYVAYQNDQWRPYTDGYWAQTDAGWTWVSYENFGWATYHYGRWTQLETTGWVWVPGYEWGPGWVSWRQNDSYVGWAPIPPKHDRVAIQRLDVGVESEPAPAPRPPAVVHEPRGIVNYDDLEEDYDVGYNASVDTAYDIGPSHYCFVPVASFGAPYVREVILPPQENFVIIGNTYNCTNISYRRGYRDGRFIYNGGPDFGFIAAHVQRPIPRLFLDRRTDIGVSSFAQRGFSPLSVVRGDRLQVVGPSIARREIRFNDVRPVRVRETLAQPRQINGWRGIQQSDPAAVQRLRAQYRQEAQVAPPAREVVNRLAAPADFRPNAPLPAPLPPPPQARFVREQGGGIGRQGAAVPGAAVVGAAVVGPQQGQPAPGGLQPANPAGRGAQDAADREARRNAQLQQMNERRAARGQAPLQPGVNPQQPGQQPTTGAAATGAQPAPQQTREQLRATRLQQQREAQQAAQQQRQQAAEQQRQQAAAAAEQRRQQQATAAQERAARGSERRGQPQQPQAGGTTATTPEPGAAAAARQEQAAQERNARQADAQTRIEQGRAATRERAEAAAQARQQQQREQTAERGQAERQQGQQQAAERQRAAEARQQQQSVATERQRAAAEARQQQAAQGRAAAQAEARQQGAAQQQQQRGAAQAEARAAAQQQAQQQQAAQRAQRQQAAPQPQAEGQPAEQGGKRKRPPEGQ